jgi:hypothetical protein
LAESKPEWPSGRRRLTVSPANRSSNGGGAAASVLARSVRLGPRRGRSTSGQKYKELEYITANMPSAQTAGTSTDCSTVILADMSQLVVGKRQDRQIQISQDYACTADQTAIR